MIYIICFIISIIFCFFANRKYSNKKIFYILSILAIMPPVLLATYRAVEIGTDVNVYLYPAFQKALSITDFMVFSNKMSYMLNDFFVQLLVFYTAKIFHDFNSLLFFIQLIICSGFYFGSFNFKEKSNPTIIYALFLFLFYNMSLNLIRQFMAMSIIFYSIKFIEKEKIKFLFFVGIACLFHKTAIIGVIMFLLKIASNSKHKILFSFLSIMTVILSLLFYTNILTFFAKIGVIPYVYVYRYSIDVSNLSFNFIDTLFLIYVMFIALIKGKKDTNDEYYFMFLMNLFALILLQIGNFVSYGNRLSYYFEMFSFVLLAMSIKDCKKEKILLIFITSIIILVYFIYVYIICQNGETYPYIFNNY